MKSNISLSTYVDYITLKPTLAKAFNAGSLSTYVDYITLKLLVSLLSLLLSLSTYVDYITLKHMKWMETTLIRS